MTIIITDEPPESIDKALLLTHMERGVEIITTAEAEKRGIAAHFPTEPIKFEMLPELLEPMAIRTPAIISERGPVYQPTRSQKIKSKRRK